MQIRPPKRVLTWLAPLLTVALMTTVLAPPTSALQDPDTTIRGTVWLDLNKDGIRQPDEPPVPGILASLAEPGLVSILSETVTTEAGTWSFSAPAGEYQVFLVSPGSFYTKPGEGDDRSLDSDLDPTGLSSALIANAGEVTVVDAGLMPFGDITITTWVDSDADGIRDAADPAGPILDVLLSPSGAPDQIVEPDAPSRYRSIDHGDYLLTVASLEDYALSPANAGTDEALDSDIDPTTRQTAVTVGPDSFRQAITIGLVPDVRTVTVTPFEDLNLNGLRDDGEPIIAVDMALFDSSANLVTNGERQPDGRLLFTAIPTDYSLTLGDASLSENWRFRPDGIATASTQITILSTLLVELEVPLTRVRTVAITLDAPGETASLIRPGLRPQPITAESPTVVDATELDGRFSLRTAAGLQVTGVDCDQIETEFTTTSPTSSTWSLDLTDAPGDATIECVVQTTKPDVAKLLIIARGSLTFSSELDAVFDDLEIDPPDLILRDLNPGTYVTQIRTRADVAAPALFCIDADVSGPQDDEFTLAIAPGSEPVCLANLVTEPDRWFAIRNGNTADVVIPHSGASQPPTLRVGESDAAPVPLESNELVDWTTRDGVVAQLALAPSEELDSFTCRGATTLATEVSFDATAGSYVIAISGDVVDPAAVCTFTTTQRVFGDVNCDGRRSILDVSIIVQYVVGIRTDNRACPTQPGAGQINLVAGDTNDDHVVDILDVFRLAQCVVELPNSLCPEPANP